MSERIKTWAMAIWEVAKEPPSIAALVYSMIAFFGAQAFDYYRAQHERYDRHVEARVLSFVDSSREFDALVASLAHGVMDKNGPDTEDRTKLIANLNRQYSELADLEPLTKSDPHLLAAYKASIEKLNKQLPQVNSVLEMKPYWEAVGDVLSARRKLDQELVRKSHLALD